MFLKSVWAASACVGAVSILALAGLSCGGQPSAAQGLEPGAELAPIDEQHFQFELEAALGHGEHVLHSSRRLLQSVRGNAHATTDSARYIAKRLRGYCGVGRYSGAVMGVLIPSNNFVPDKAYIAIAESCEKGAAQIEAHTISADSDILPSNTVLPPDTERSPAPSFHIDTYDAVVDGVRVSDPEYYLAHAELARDTGRPVQEVLSWLETARQKQKDKFSTYEEWARLLKRCGELCGGDSGEFGHDLQVERTASVYFEQAKRYSTRAKVGGK